MSSEVLTVIKLDAAGWSGRMFSGRLTRAEAISKAREAAAADKRIAESILSAPDDSFEIHIVRGKLSKHPIKELKP